MMTDNAQLTQYLNEYIKMNKPQFAVMITGKWGCGKTYYIQQRIEEWSKTKGKTSKEKIELKPIYVSVNGLSTMGSLMRKIRAVLYPFLYSKGIKVAKKVLVSVLRIATKSELDLDGDGVGENLDDFVDTEGILELFKSNSDEIKGERVLVFDDIERCRIPLDELFGFVNGIVEYSNSKVILICDEERLKKVAEQEKLKVGYNEFKEKLVGQTFSLAIDYAGVTGAFIDSAKSPILDANRDLIIDLFVASRCENLRLARHCLIDVTRFFDQLPNGVKKNSSYNEFVSNVVAYLVITSLEARFGNLSIEKYQSYTFSEEDKKANQEFENKYLSILEHYQMYSSVYTIPIIYLLGFVRSGYIDNPKQLIQGCRMLQSHNLSDWEKLWRCDKLSNDEFLEILKKEKEKFYSRSLEYVFEVAHMAGILLSLEKRKLTKLSRSFVVMTAKRHITEIYATYPDDLSRTMLNTQGYEFQESNSAEMKEIMAHSVSLFQARIDKIKKEYVISVWNGFGANTTRESLNKQFEETTPMNQNKYAYESIFTQVSPREIAGKIVALPNGAKVEFASFLVERYYLNGSGVIGNVWDEMKADKTNLAKISSILKIKAKRLKLLDKEKTLYIASKIDEAVSKM